MLRGILHVLGVAAAFTLVACGGDGADSDVSQAPTTTGEEGTALPEPITASSAEELSLDELLVREITMEGGPDQLVEAFSSLWVKRDDGVVVRVDAAAGKVTTEVSTVPFKQPVCQGLGASEDAIWACPRAGTVVRIDPGRNEVEAEVAIDKLLEQTQLVDAAGSIWVLTKDGGELTAIDNRTNKPANPIPLGGTCTDLAGSGDEIWVSCYVDSRLLRIDAAAGKIVEEVELDRPRAIALGEDLWVGFDSGLAQLDPESLRVTTVYDVFPGTGGAVFAAGHEVWVREDGGHFLVRIDGDAETITEVIDAPKLRSGGDVITVGDSVWATAYDDAALVELEAP